MTSQYSGSSLHQERLAAGLLGGDQRRARAAEQVQHVLAGRDEYCIARAASSTGFSVRWTIALRVDLLDGPQVGGVVRAEELVGGALLPAVEAPFMVAHEVLARQHRMLLVPDDRLGEVQAVRSSGPAGSCAQLA